MAPWNSAFVKSFCGKDADTGTQTPFPGRWLCLSLFLSTETLPDCSCGDAVLSLPSSAFVWDGTAHHEDCVFQILA